MITLTNEQIIEYMEIKKGVKVEKLEACKGAKKYVYLVNENYIVEFKANGNYLPSSVGNNYKAKITGRKINKKEYNFYKDLYKETTTLI